MWEGQSEKDKKDRELVLKNTKKKKKNRANDWGPICVKRGWGMNGACDYIEGNITLCGVGLGGGPMIFRFHASFVGPIWSWQPIKKSDDGAHQWNMKFLRLNVINEKNLKNLWRLGVSLSPWLSNSINFFLNKWLLVTSNLTQLDSNEQPLVRQLSSRLPTRRRRGGHSGGLINHRTSVRQSCEVGPTFFRSITGPHAKSYTRERLLITQTPHYSQILKNM